MRLELYVRDPCPLCEHAVEALHQAEIGPWTAVDISDSEELMQRYRLRIPVLRDLDSGAEIGWPFDAWMLRQRFNSRDDQVPDFAPTSTPR